MKNISELRDELATVFEGLRNGSVDVKVASEMNNAAGKMINTLKVQLEYAHLSGKKPDIAWLAGKQ